MVTTPGSLLPAGLPFLSGQEVDDLATRMYLAMVRHGRATQRTLLETGFTPREVDEGLALLIRRELIREHSEGEWQVLPPKSALPRMAAGLERQASLARAAAHGLNDLYQQGRQQTPLEDAFAGVEPLGSVEEIHRAAADLAATARSRIRSMKDSSLRTRLLLGSPLEVHRVALLGVDGQVLHQTTVYDVSLLELEGFHDVLEVRMRTGDQVRFAEGVPFSAIVIDDDAALVDTSARDASGLGSFVVRSRPLVGAIAATVDAAWRLAVPVKDQPLDGRPGGVPLGERDQKVLALLASGVSDATAARHLGVSQRTVERRVRYLMDRLGVATRFQAGVQAARRGWI